MAALPFLSAIGRLNTAADKWTGVTVFRLAKFDMISTGFLVHSLSSRLPLHRALTRSVATPFAPDLGSREQPSCCV